jgi:nitrogen fixation protein
MYNLSSKILYRLKLKLDRIKDSYNSFVSIKLSRNEAKAYRKQVIAARGRSIIDRKLMREIKDYSKAVFGNTSYWPWLALYTELRGEFKRGWMPDDYYRFEFLAKMNPERYMKFSDAKTIDHKLFEEFMIEPLFFRSNGQFCLKDGTVISKSEVYGMLNDIDEEIIIKPDNGRGGKRITFKHSSELRLDELPTDTDLVFQKVFIQHEELQKLYPHSVNTFRVQTFIDDKGEIIVKFVYLRFGKGGSKVDNTSSGGGWVFIDSEGTVSPHGYEDFGLGIGKAHPDTGVTYADLNFPFLPKIKDFCKRAHRSFPQTRVIGWDVCVDEQGEPKLMECK